MLRQAGTVVAPCGNDNQEAQHEVMQRYEVQECLPTLPKEFLPVGSRSVEQVDTQDCGDETL